jgi:predicted SAM-dependent methyltransferase
MKLDFGCGQNPTPGYEGVDIVPLEGVTHVVDLKQFPYPFEDESVEEIVSNHFVEHLTGDERIKFFNECYRILIPGGTMRHVHPYYKSVRAVQDPTHQWPPISENQYFYWSANWMKANKLEHYPIKCNFEFQIAYTWQDPQWANKNDQMQQFAINHYFNVVADMIVNMKKIPMP